MQAPWQNGVCERGGGVLKAILGAIVKSQSVVGESDLQVALQEAVTAYNNDVTDAGVSPAQAALKDANPVFKEMSWGTLDRGWQSMG